MLWRIGTWWFYGDSRSLQEVQWGCFKGFFTILYDSRSIQHDQHIQDWIMMLLWDNKVTQEDQQCECNEGLDHDASLMTPCRYNKRNRGCCEKLRCLYFYGDTRGIQHDRLWMLWRIETRNFYKDTRSLRENQQDVSKYCFTTARWWHQVNTTRSSWMLGRMYDYDLMGQQDNAIRSAMWIYLFGLNAGKWTVKVLEGRSSSETCSKWINLCQARFQDHSIVTQG